MCQKCRCDLAGHLCKAVVKVLARVEFLSGGLNREGSSSPGVLEEIISLQLKEVSPDSLLTVDCRPLSAPTCPSQLLATGVSQHGYLD